MGNITIITPGPVIIKPQKFADVLKQEATPVKYVNKLSR